MANHYHLVLYVDAARARGWSLSEVVERWTQLFSLPVLVARWQSGQAQGLEGAAAERTIEGWRERLQNISWFMKCLNEHLARRANAEENCTGRFWEGRFRSQALLDEAGLLTAMAYVDLNPIRAGVATTPETSEFSSIYQRIRDLKSADDFSSQNASHPALRPFRSSLRLADNPLPCELPQYLHLIDWSGRTVRAEKRGFIDGNLPPIIERLNIDPDAWQLAMQRQGNVFGRAMGRLNHLRLHAQTLGQSWIRGLRQAEHLYG